MSALEYLRLLGRHWRVAAATLAAFLVLAILLTATTTKQYRADTQVFVAATSTATNANQLSLANAYLQARVQSYPTVATSPMVTEPVIAELHLGLTPSQLAARITATAPLNTVLINLSVTDPSPTRAARIADSVATHFSTVVEEIEQTAASKTAPVKLTITRRAQVPTAPVAPKPVVNIAVALVLGSAIGVGLAVLRGMLDRTFRDPDLLAEITHASSLASIPRDRSAPQRPLVITSGSQGRRADAFRQLRTNLQYVAVDDPPRIIAIASALAGEGKTTTALNLAAALAEAGHDVCLLEADLRRPTLARSLGLVSEVGLTSVVVGATTVEEALQPLTEHLAVLASGTLPPNPSEVLASKQTRDLIERLGRTFDYTIVDTAPLLPVTDGVEVASMADATLLITRAGKTTHQQVAAAVALLAKVDVQPVGSVLNVAGAGG